MTPPFSQASVRVRIQRSEARADPFDPTKVGTFDVDWLPYVPDWIQLQVIASGCSGPVRLRAEMVPPGQIEPQWTGEGEESPTPGGNVAWHPLLNRPELAVAGTYTSRVWINSEKLADTTFDVKLTSTNPFVR